MGEGSDSCGGRIHPLFISLLHTSSTVYEVCVGTYVLVYDPSMNETDGSIQIAVHTV